MMSEDFPAVRSATVCRGCLAGVSLLIDDFQVDGSSLILSSLNQVAGCGVYWPFSPSLALAYAFVFLSRVAWSIVFKALVMAFSADGLPFFFGYA